ncbi:MAG: hypothetical protein H6978_05950 [Gammaproteobacteria bacterium]|nr:hypothetical protein [Gammaproteobacteria bacterium]
MTADNPELILSTNVREHFQHSVTAAMSRQQVAAEDVTINYLVNLLTEFAHTDRLFESTDDGVDLKPLAFLYGEALEADHPEVRNRALKRLGDIALFIAGVFAESLSRKLVDVDYYVAMGGNAYSYLSDVMRGSPFAISRSVVFEELAEKFVDFVDVVGEAGSASQPTSAADTLRLYEIWLATGSKRASRRLAELGIHVAPFGCKPTRH